MSQKTEKKILDNTFHLAITMAGAVSAGAYTAGVMDYLLETLDKWEKIKTDKNFKDKLPTHNIQIDVISGASAGGMTACLTTLVLFEKERQHVDFSTLADDRTKNRLYNAWVNLPYKGEKMTKFKAAEVMLNDDDVKEIDKFNKTLKEKEKKVRFPISLLNSLIVRKVAEKIIELNEKEKKEFNLKNRAKYVAEDLDIFVTLTNLKGFQSIIPLKSSDSNYIAQYVSNDHRDLMMFNVGVKKKGNIKLDFAVDSEEAKDSINLLKNAAVSTGAFPIGLEYGFIERKPEYINENILLKKMHSPFGKNIIRSDLTKYSVAMIDGGLIDNEPFELTDTLIKDRLGDKSEKKYSLLMIDPFPSQGIEPETESIFIDAMHKNYPYSFWGAIAQLIMTARSQLVVKSAKNRNETSQEPALIKEAINDENTSCFLISPRRRDLEENKVFEGSNAIACGTLGGFGGFIHEDFRKHDFFLGRSNCKSFFQKHFKFEASLLEDEESPFYQAYDQSAQEVFLITDNNGNKFFPIIPDVAIFEKSQGIESPDYDQLKKEQINEVSAKNKFPKLTESEFDKFYDSIKPLMKKRLKLILGTVVPNCLMIILSPLNYFLINYGLSALKEKIILRDLKKRGIVET